MDILEFAMKMELDGKAFYDKHARRTPDNELKRIFKLLSEEEERHYQFFKKLQDGKHEEAVAQINNSSDTLKQVNNIFIDMTKDNSEKIFGEDELTAWTEALHIEEKAESFYREKAKDETDIEKQKLLIAIADEEQNHVHMIEGVLTYLKFPEAFADSAQFKNFQSLEGH
jgi:rubrerythrin